MKKLITITLFFGLCINSISQNPTWQWIKGGYNGGSFPVTHMGVDNEGNIYGMCKYSGGLKIDTSQWLTSYGYDDFCVFSFTCDGKFRWVKRFGGNVYDSPAGLTVLKNGETIITGNVGLCNWGNAWFADSMLTANNSICKAVFICKLDKNGKIIYLKFPSKEYESRTPYFINHQIDHDGKIQVLATFLDSNTWGNFHIPDFGNYMLKFNPNNGNLVDVVKIDLFVGKDTSSLFPTFILYNTTFKIDSNGDYFLLISDLAKKIFIGNDTINIDIYSNYQYRGTLAKFNPLGQNVWFTSLRFDTTVSSDSAYFDLSYNFNMDDKNIYLNGFKLSFLGTYFMGFPVYNPIAELVWNRTKFIAVFNKNTGNIVNFRNLWVREDINADMFSCQVKNGKLYDGGIGGMIVLNNGADTIKPYPDFSYFSTDGYFPFLYEIDTGLTHYNWSIAMKSVRNSVYYPGSMYIDHNDNIYIGAYLSGGFALPQDTIKQYSGSYILKIAHNNDSCGCVPSIPVLSVVGSSGNTLTVKGNASNSFDSLYVLWGDGDSTLYSNPGSNISHTFSHSGPWKVCLRTYAFCGDKDTCLANLYSGTQNLNQTTFTLFPNPTYDKISVIFKDIPKNGVELQLLDITGRILLNRFFFNQNYCTLDISNMNPGVYILKINTLGEESKSIKVIKK